MKDIDKGFKEAIKKLQALKSKTLQAGILASAGTNNKTATLIAEYAHYNEFGTKNIPARSFIGSTFDEQNNGWFGKLDNIVDKVIENKVTNIDLEIGLLGERMVGDIKEKITSNIPPALKLPTIKRKKSSKTLIDTGIMRNSIKFEIVDK